jgi:two-component system, NarL family, sensor histidine kinase UhpB
MLLKIQKSLNRVPIFYRLLVGNTTILVITTTSAILAVKYFRQVSIWVWILIFSIIGFSLVFILNYATIRISFRSLYGLINTLDQVSFEKTSLPARIILETDPDIQPLAESINAMLERLEHTTKQLRALSERATNAQETERKRIARNLHDDTSQALSTLIISLERLENDLPPDAQNLIERCRQARLVATRTLEDLRKIIYDLRPTMLDDLGLVPAMRWYARSIFEEAGIRVQFEIPQENLRLPDQLETELFRIIQEGVNNIARHSNARWVKIRMVQKSDHVLLELEDNGSGFDVKKTASTAVQNKRLGLIGIQERAALVGGEVSIHSEPDMGTLLQIKIPLL